MGPGEVKRGRDGAAPVTGAAEPQAEAFRAWVEFLLE
jgi:hypothetical protein